MKFTIMLVFLAMAAGICAGGYLGESRVSKYILQGANELEKEKFRIELLKEREGQCTGVDCSIQGAKVIECLVKSCYPTGLYYSQKCALVSAATGPNPCYYKHKPAVVGAAYPECCEDYTGFCKGDDGFQESELPKYTPEEIEECKNTPIMISK